MPVCPGCERRVTHERLPIHNRCCDALSGSGEYGTPTPERIEQYLSQLDDRLAEVSAREAEMDQRFQQLESELQPK